MEPDLERTLTAAGSLARRLSHSADEVRTLLPVTGTELAYMPERFRTEADALFHRVLTLHSLLFRRLLPAVLGDGAAMSAPADLAGRMVQAGLADDAEAVLALFTLRALLTRIEAVLRG